MRVCVISIIPMTTFAAGMSFLGLGDWGGRSDSQSTTPAQKSTASGMSKVADKLGVRDILLLGDNFYQNGVSSSTSSRFEKTFEEVYTTDIFGNSTFRVIAGNHDHWGTVNAQVQHKDKAGRWQFPSLWYTLNYSFTSGSGKTRTLQVVMTDSVDLAGNSDDNCLGSSVCLPFPPPAHNQWTWIEDQLKSSSADFLWVAGHYPIYSAGAQGPTSVLVKKLLPLLKKYGAHYISGHDHMLQHIIYEGVNQVISGMGKECCYGADSMSDVPSGAVKFMISGNNGQGRHVGPKPASKVEGGFISLQFDDVVTMTYYDQDGKVLFTAPALQPRNQTAVVV